MLPFFNRLCNGLCICAVAIVLILVLSVGVFAEPSNDVDVKLKRVRAAIAHKGAKWIARQTDPSLRTSHKLCGWIRGEDMSTESSAAQDLTLQSYSGLEPLPTFWDWRNVDGHDWTTHIQDQGGCGSCYVFATCAVSEAAMKIQSGSTGWQANPDFSEQFLVSCAGFDCGGGSTTPVYNYLVANGAPPDSCFPYTANDDQPCSDRCPDWESRLTKILGWQRVADTDTPTIEQIKSAIMTYGPVTTGFDVYTDFMYYSGGVYEHTWGVLEGGHAVAIIGWDDSQRCWIAKNSWGTNWGETADYQPYTSGAGDGGWFRITWDDEWFGQYAKYAIAALTNVTSYSPAGWTGPVVPRNSSGATLTSCALTSTLPGNSTGTYLNYSVACNAGLNPPIFDVVATIDGEEVDRQQVSDLEAGSFSCINDVGPVLVHGGRHTYGILIDADNSVPENDESTTESPFDNIECRQFVWSPIALTSSMPRYAPPVKDAWGDAPSPRYYNCDGFTFDVDQTAWSAVATLCPDIMCDYNIKLWGAGDYQGSSTGFGPNALLTSDAGSGFCDIVLVNGKRMTSGTYSAGVINENGGTADYRVEHESADAISLRPAVEWNGPYTMNTSNIIDLYQISLSPGNYGIKLDQLTGDCALCMALYDSQGTVFNKYDTMPGGLVQNSFSGDKSIDVTIPTLGIYGLTVYKYGSADWDTTTSYRLAVSHKDIYVLSPNGGEIVGLGETVPITWESYGDIGSVVDIMISRDGGITSTTLAADVPNTGVYNWVASGKVSNYAKITVMSNDGTCGDASDNTFRIISRSLVITSPNGGEDLIHGDTEDITWNSSNVDGDIKLELSRDLGATWEAITESTLNDGSYTWTVVPPGSTACLVRVSSINNPTCYDISDSSFIIEGPSIHLTYPTTGETWGIGEQETITWTSENLTGLVNIQLSRNNGSTWTNIATNIADTGSYDWTVTSPASSTCRLKIVSVDFPEALDVRSAISIVQRTITLTEPVSSSTLEIGNTQTVAWTGEYLDGSVKIEISHDNRATWTTLIDSAPTGATSGQATIVVPGPPANSCFIRVSSVDNPSVADSNDSSFRITGKWIFMDTPNGGEVLFAGDTEPIYWSAAYITGLCGIDLSTDSGATWQSLVGNFSVVQCMWNWHIGDINSTHCRIRIRSYEYPEVVAESAADFTVAKREIHVTSPVGGEKWCIGTTKSINWTSSNVDGDVSILLWDEDNQNTTTIESSTPNDGSYSWTVAGTDEQNVKVRVRSNSYTSVMGESAGAVELVDSLITVLSPNGGEVILTGASTNITWQSYNVPEGNVMIELSRDSGATWETIAASTANDGQATWICTSPLSSRCLIRITSLADPTMSDTSDNTFKILTRSLTITQPNGGEIWETGTTQTISWTRLNCTGNVKIELTRDGGSTFETIVASTSATSSYQWTVTSPVSTSCKVKITSLSYPTVYDSSNAVFTITDRGITVTAPTVGAQYTVGEISTITWTSRNLPTGNVKIEISRDSGANWSTLAASISNSGSAAWVVSGPDSDHCLIRVTSLADPTISDVTDGEFAIATRSIDILSPVAGDTWGIGETRSITWQTTNIDGTLTIDLTRDRGDTIETLTTDAENTGEYVWTVTGPESSDCAVRISSNSYSVTAASQDTFNIHQPVSVPIEVTLEDWIHAPDGKQVDVGIHDPNGGVVLETHTVTLDEDGHARFDTLLTGVYDVTFGVTHWLTTTVKGVTIENSMSDILVSLPNGDCNADDTVNLADFEIVKADWAASTLSNQYADINGDGSCDVTDLAIVRKNMGYLQNGGSNGLVMWLGDATGASISAIKCEAGEPFDIYVWAATTTPTWFIDAALGFDTATTSGPLALPVDRKILLATGNPALDIVWCDALSFYHNDICARLSGFYSSTTGIRQYGADLASASMGNVVQSFTSMKLAKISLMHNMQPGDSTTIGLWDDGTNTARAMNTMAMGAIPIYGATDTVQIVAYIADTIADAKASPDMDSVAIMNASISAAFGDTFYIESDDRSIGIQVYSASHGLAAGMRVNVEGTVSTDSNEERYIQANSLGFAGSCDIKSFVMTSKSLGGGDWCYNEYTGAGQCGVFNGAGTNNIGLLVTIVGSVKGGSTGFFYIDDGSGCDDGSGYTGVRVSTPGLTPPNTDTFVRVTGISSIYMNQGVPHRLVKVSDSSGIVPMD